MIFDLHNDFVTAVPPRAWTAEIERYAAAGVCGIVFAVFTTEIAPCAEDFGKYAPPDAPFKTLTAIEDLGSVRTTDLGEFLRRTAPCYVSLTWNGQNRFGGGTGCEMPLTREGERALLSLEALGIPLDLSHLSDTSLRTAMDKFGGRVLVSHTAARSLSGHPRCMTDETAKLVASRGGIIGVAAIPSFLTGGKCDRSAYLRHISHFAEIVGTKHVGIGTDFNGGKSYPSGLTEYADFAALKEDMSDIGFTETEIEDIFYNNVCGFFRSAEDL